MLVEIVPTIWKSSCEAYKSSKVKEKLVEDDRTSERPQWGKESHHVRQEKTSLKQGKPSEVKEAMLVEAVSTSLRLAKSRCKE